MYTSAKENSKVDVKVLVLQNTNIRFGERNVLFYGFIILRTSALLSYQR